MCFYMAFFPTGNSIFLLISWGGVFNGFYSIFCEKHRESYDLTVSQNYKIELLKSQEYIQKIDDDFDSTSQHSCCIQRWGMLLVLSSEVFNTVSNNSRDVSEFSSGGND